MRICALIVLYKLQLADSTTYRTLEASRAEFERQGSELKILVWDNTPGGQSRGVLPPDVDYHSDPSNPGLAVAYNQALGVANAKGYSWLITLDQDTVLPGSFLTRIASVARELDGSPEIASIVPIVVGDGRHLSPFRLRLGFLPKAVKSRVDIEEIDGIYAVNSGATLRVASLLALGGVNPHFPLDISDIEMYYRLHRAGKRTYVVADLTIEHNFSLLDKRHRMTLERYRSQLLDECEFWDTRMGRLARLERMVRLAGRSCKDICSGGPSAFVKLTFGELLRRLFTSRRQRAEEWRAWAGNRMKPAVGAADSAWVSFADEEVPHL